MAVQAAATTSRAGVPATIDVDVGRPGPAIPPTFGGLMTEEVNHSYDGGLFAELVQNRTFQDGGRPEADAPVHWSVVGSGRAVTDRADPVNVALPISLRLELSGGTGGIANDGYWGIPVRPGTTYTASFYARGGDGFAGPVTAALVTDDGHATVAEAATPPVGPAWKRYTVTLTTDPAAATTAKAKFVLSATGSGSVGFSLVSLFPPTYMGTPGGLRPDLMKLLADLRPAFIRLPGGNYLEGGSFLDRFNWKQMIGPADRRPGHMGCWGYRSSDGFGLPQYLLWCKQLDAEPVLAVFAGYTLTGDHATAGSPGMSVYTQEALDEIEYVTGPADRGWGKRRAADGFPEPFKLTYVEIGNEDGFDKSGSYDGRFTQMATAIRARYPELKIIATSQVKGFRPDLYDDHYYSSARQMVTLAGRYDPARPGDRSGPGHAGETQTFVGEWASQEGRPTPDLTAALGDAAFVMGLERNADLVRMECYAPLLANVSPADPAKGYPKGWQWPTNLIGYDALHSFGSPSYYAQAMLAQNRGDVVLPTTTKAEPAAVAAEPAPHGSVGVGTWHTQAEYKDIVVTAPDGRPLLRADLSDDTRGWQFTGSRWDLRDKAIKPSAADAESWAITGDPRMTDYTVRLRARKAGGQEGFIVLWHAVDGDNYRWWNVGGWGNTVARCEAADAGSRSGFGPGTPYTVEADRWYDLRLEIAGHHIRGFVDGKLVTEADDESHAATPTAVTASATYARADRTVIVKVVNVSDGDVDVTVNLRGVGRVEPTGKAVVLTGDPRATNSVAEPTKIAPRDEAVTNASASLRRTFPSHSFTILRLTVDPT